MNAQQRDMDAGETSNDGAAGPSFATRTDVGRKRSHNEDFVLTRVVNAGLLVVVCDGMGGHIGGMEASSLAATTVAESAEGAAEVDPATILRAAADAAGRRLHLEIEQRPDLADMGTTLVAAIVRDSMATVANIGDSRAYRFASGELERVTCDHSLVEELVQRGEITREQAAQHPQRNVITRALSGSFSGEPPDIFSVPLRDKEMLLLATDGLHGMIDDAMIAQILGTSGSPESICERLVASALDAGGADNITVALVVGGGAVKAHLAGPDTDPHRSGYVAGHRSRIIASLFLAVVFLTCLWYFWIDPVMNQQERLREAAVQDSLNRDTSGTFQDTVAAPDTPSQVGPGALPPWTRFDDSVRIGDTLDI